MITDHNKHPFLGAEVGDLEIVPFYADNEIVGQELRFSVPAYAWNEFENSRLFQELSDFVQSLEIQIPNTHNCNHDPLSKLEILPCVENSTFPAGRGSLWALIRKVFQKR